MHPPLYARNRMQFALHPLALAALVMAFSSLTLCAQNMNPPSNSPHDQPNPRMRGLRPNQFSTLPATPTTSQPPAPTPAANTLPAPIAATPLAAASITAEHAPTRPHRALVTYTNGQLDVRANDSSLNQILRAISKETGLTITGGVADQRVFGNYGPASTSSIVSTLLDGTGTNILLLEGNDTTPPQLTLTPRGGGPTPPSPDAPGFDDGIDSPARPVQNVQIDAPQQPQQVPVSGPQPLPQPLNNINGSPNNTTPTASQIPTVQSIPTDAVATPSTAPSVSGIVDSTNPPPANSTTGTQSGTAPITPEQVAQQLLKMQQQQKPAPPATPVNPQ
jgi:hypothetical protein